VLIAAGKSFAAKAACSPSALQMETWRGYHYQDHISVSIKRNPSLAVIKLHYWML